MSVPWGGSYEWGVRPFSVTDYLQGFLARVPPENLDAVASIRWGKPSDFNIERSGFQTHTTTVIYWQDPDDEDEEIPEWTEIAADVEQVRVENPDDPDQYVIEERKTASVFQRPDGSKVKFVFGWELPTIAEIS